MKTFKSSIGLLIILSSISSFCVNCNKDDNTAFSKLNEALQKAGEIATDELPGSLLAEINGIEIDGLGNTSSPGEWTFYYFVPVGNDYDYLAVSVEPDGKTRYWDPGGSITFTAIPEYSSAQAWVVKGDDIMASHDRSFNFRSLQVFADEDNSYPGTDNLVYVYYYEDADGEHIAYIILDADTGTTLLVELNP